MSILDIKARFSQRILDAEKEEKVVANRNGSGSKVVEPTDIREVDVGINSYVSDLPGFLAVIKQRFSDFNVHEIDPEGNIVELNSYDVPDEVPQEIEAPECLSSEILASVEKLLTEDGDDEPVTIDVTDKSKEDRKSIHRYVKGKYGDAVISDTQNINDKSITTIRKTKKGVKDSRPPSHLPKYLHFTLSKSNMDTTEALNLLGTKLRLKAKNFNICGTKDKRGNTSQRVSVERVLASRLINLNKTLRKMCVGNFQYKDSPLRLGALKGNNFQIALRGVNASDEEIDSAFTQLKERGFINYFGLQRFGKCAECPTSEIGLQIIKEAYGNAVELILKPRKNVESPDIQQARSIWASTKDPGQAYAALRHGDRYIEGKILYGLKTNGSTAFSNALELLPRNVRMLYLHSYQSLVWNKVVSRRVAEYGLKVLEGDLVYADEANGVVADTDEGTADETADLESEQKAERDTPVKVLTSDDLASYEIYDIVLPLPGTTTVYPDNEMRKWYQEILAEDGLTVDSFSSKVRQYCLGGSYRKMIQRPKNLSWKIMRYSRSDEDLILGDIDIMNGKKLLENPDGLLKAVVVTFDLNSSTYATMALREVLRADTSSSHQTHLHDSLKRESEEEQGGIAKKVKEDNDAQTPELNVPT